MPLNKYFRRPAVIVLVGLCVAWLFCEVMRAQTEADAIRSHQAQWNCWAQESRKVARCRALWQPVIEDADYCDEAVLACKANGADARVNATNERADLWRVITAWHRLALLVAVVGLLSWWAIVQPVPRMLQRTRRQETR